MKIHCYRNLHRREYSIQGSDRRVIDHAPVVALTDAVFTVRPAGREKVRRTGTKNVHAFVSGSRVDVVPIVDETWARITYNPYIHASFVMQSPSLGAIPVWGASRVVLTPDGVFARGLIT